MQSEQNYRILVVDDIAAIHQDFRKLLLKEETDELKDFDQLHASLFRGADEKKPDSTPPFEIDSAYQSNEALTSVQNSLETHKPYALAFVDGIMPPGEDGIETIRRIWEVDPDIQTVVCTAFTLYSREEINKRLGHSDRLFILPKPFDRTSVLQISGLLTKKWNIQRTLQADQTSSDTLQKAQLELKSIADELKESGYLLSS